MASSLYSKDAVADLVLLETINETEILNTLKRRHAKDLIYTYIGHVLISVNPFKEIGGLYSESEIGRYRGRYLYENPPHVFALAESAYRQLGSDHEDQVVIISGESGAGKTEASKKIMQYIAAVTGSGPEIERVKNQILKSNPVLEAFGNAKTLRNNNSSRFGKYMEIFFDFKGDPVGGRITNYLLEKSRVVGRAQDERCFHIFYQLIEGIRSSDRDRYQIRSPDQFAYLKSSGCYKVDKMSDREEFDLTHEGMTAMGMSELEIQQVFKIVSAVLWIGNVEFSGGDKSKVMDDSTVKVVADLLGCDLSLLSQGLIKRSITAGGSKAILTELNVEQARYTRDALAKTLYFRLFDYVVARINEALAPSNIREFKAKEMSTIGVLDIYGFEIFQTNGFEQFCINFTNEKLQQVFIEKTIKSEQEEYAREGIAWTPIEYFNNKIVCELIEKKPLGILAFLDEECLLGKGTDGTFLDKLASNLGSHPHFERPAGVGRPNDVFIVKHYAGDVAYTQTNFLDRNRDLVWKDLLLVGESSTLPVMRTLFPPGGAEAMGKQRPITAGSSFRTQVNALVDSLAKCAPHYIRCIKTNESKRANLFEDAMVLHQVRYLGLYENVRVRRAGFAFRMTYDRFLQRYKMLCAQTWPHYNSDPASGCRLILNGVSMSEGSQYQMGKTKVFIRQPVSLFSLEELRERKVNDLIILIQKVYRAYKTRKYFLELREKSLGIFGRNKQRRRQSVKRFYVGDYLQLTKNLIVQKMMDKHLEKNVLFCDEVEKINRKFKTQTRVMLLTDQALYNLGTGKYKFNRRMEIRNISGVSLSPYADNFLVVHVAKEYDYVFVCERKTEFLTALNDEYIRITSNSLDIKFAKNIPFKTKKGSNMFLDFTLNESAPATTYVPSSTAKETLAITVGKIDTVNDAFLAKITPKKMNIDSKPVKKNHMRGISVAHYGQNEATTPRMFNIGGGSSVAPLQNSNNNTGDLWTRALDNFEANDERELSFNKNDVLRILSQEDNGWWSAELNGKLGYVPSTYLEVIKNPNNNGRRSSYVAPLPKR